MIAEILLVVLGLGLISSQQPLTGVEKWRPLANRLTTESTVVRGLRNPLAAAAQASPEPLFFVAGTDGKLRAKARIGFLPNDRIALSLSVSGPVNEEGEGDFLTSSGLEQGVVVSGSSSWILSKRTQVVVPDRVTNRMLRRKVLGHGEIDGLLDRALKSASTERSATLQHQALERGAHGTQRSVTPAELSPHDPLDRRAVTRAWLETLRKGELEYLDAVVLSGGFSVGRSDFSFLEPSTLVPAEVSETNRGVEIGIAYQRGRGTGWEDESLAPLFYAGASYTGGRSFKGGSISNICSPVEGTLSLQCRDIAVGPPQSTDVQEIAVDLRYWLANGKLALTNKSAYDFGTDTWTVQFPAYFFRKVEKVDDPDLGKSPGLTGGVSAGWSTRSGRREFFVTLFVGTLLGIPGL